MNFNNTILTQYVQNTIISIYHQYYKNTEVFYIFLLMLWNAICIFYTYCTCQLRLTIFQVVTNPHGVRGLIVKLFCKTIHIDPAILRFFSLKILSLTNYEDPLTHPKRASYLQYWKLKLKMIKFIKNDKHIHVDINNIYINNSCIFRNKIQRIAMFYSFCKVLNICLSDSMLDSLTSFCSKPSLLSCFGWIKHMKKIHTHKEI